MIHDTLDKDFTLWLAAKAKQGLLMPCHDEEAPMLTREEALTLSVLGDAIAELQRASDELSRTFTPQDIAYLAKLHISVDESEVAQ